jgi:hypothetical protein
VELDFVINQMKQIFIGVPYGIDHTLKVLENSKILTDGELIDEKTREIVFFAATLHDIGAVEAQRKHNSMQGHFQEIEGPPIARRILEQAGIPSITVDRVCYMVGFHHTPKMIDGLDFQILWESDFLEYLQYNEGNKDPDSLLMQITENFQTATGRRLALERLGLSSTSGDA